MNLRERLLANYNSHVLHARDVDPFKLALIKIIGRIDPQRCNIPLVIASTEDWAWFQLAMVRINHARLISSKYLIQTSKDRRRGCLSEGFCTVAFSIQKIAFRAGRKAPKGYLGTSPPYMWPFRASKCSRDWTSPFLTGSKSVAALYDIPELQVEAVHLAVALSYYGLLRVPIKAESSDVEIRECSSLWSPRLLNRV